MPIGGKGLNSGIRGGLWEKKHSDAMGEAIWLFGWLVHRQTTQRNGSGFVLRGKPLTYADISGDTGWPARTLRRWLATLQKAGYVEVKYSTYCQMVIRVLNAKKFNPRQLEFPATTQEPSRPNSVDLNPSGRPKVADLSRPDSVDLGTKSGRLKEGTEIEHKHPGNKNNAAQTAALGFGPALPDWIPTETWAEFVRMRAKIRRPMTEYAAELAIRKLGELKATGNDPGLVLEQSILNSWQGLFPLKGENGHKEKRHGHDFSETDRSAERFLRRVDEMASKVGQTILNRPA